MCLILLTFQLLPNMKFMRVIVAIICLNDPLSAEYITYSCAQAYQTLLVQQQISTEEIKQ